MKRTIQFNPSEASFMPSFVRNGNVSGDETSTYRFVSELIFSELIFGRRHTKGQAVMFTVSGAHKSDKPSFWLISGRKENATSAHRDDLVEQEKTTDGDADGKIMNRAHFRLFAV